jgi:hypothetical protein
MVNQSITCALCFGCSSGSRWCRYCCCRCASSVFFASNPRALSLPDKCVVYADPPPKIRSNKTANWRFPLGRMVAVCVREGCIYGILSLFRFSLARSKETKLLSLSRTCFFSFSCSPYDLFQRTAVGFTIVCREGERGRRRREREREAHVAVCCQERCVWFSYSLPCFSCACYDSVTLGVVIRRHSVIL